LVSVNQPSGLLLADARLPHLGLVLADIRPGSVHSRDLEAVVHKYDAIKSYLNSMSEALFNEDWNSQRFKLSGKGA